MTGSLLFAQFTFNVQSLWFQLPVAILCAYAFVSLMYWKRAAIIFFPKTLENRVGKPVPWTAGIGLAFFIVFAIVGPALGTLAVIPFQKFFPDFPQPEAAKVEPNIDVQFKGSAQELYLHLKENESDPNIAIEEDPLDVTEPIGSSTPANTTPQQGEDNVEALNNSAENITTSDAPSVADLHDGSVNNTDEEERDLSTQHPVARMLIRAKEHSYFPLIFTFFIISVLIAAPITEEFIFRVIIQGGFERLAYERQERKRSVPNTTDDTGTPLPIPELKFNLATFLTVVVPPAFIFSILHFSVPEDPNAPELVSSLFKVTLSGLVGNFFTLLAAVVYLRKIYRAKSQDLGLGAPGGAVGKRFVRYLNEFSQGTILLFFALPAIYLIQNAAKIALPGIVVDPIPILIFALWEGVVYLKTHSYPTVIGMHFALNFTSFLFLCISLS